MYVRTSIAPKARPGVPAIRAKAVLSDEQLAELVDPALSIEAWLRWKNGPTRPRGKR